MARPIEPCQAQASLIDASESCRQTPAFGRSPRHRNGARSSLTFLPRITIPKPVAILILSLCVALFAFHPMSPAVPQWGLDASWVTVMGEAAERHLRWGVDLAFPYGPASSLLTGYGDSRFLTRTLPAVLAVSLAFGCGAILLFASGRQHARVGIPAGAVDSLAITIAGTRGFPDVVLLLLPLLPYLLTVASRGPSRVDALCSAVLAFVVGVTGMAKMSFVILALPLFAMGDVTLLIRRRVPYLLPSLPRRLPVRRSDSGPDGRRPSRRPIATMGRCRRLQRSDGCRRQPSGASDLRDRGPPPAGRRRPGRGEGCAER